MKSISQDLLDAVIDAYGFTKKEARKYIKQSSKEAQKELVHGFRANAKKCFEED